MSETSSLFEIRNLEKTYPVSREGVLSSLFGQPDYLRAVDDVSFDIKKGEILGLAGQSGCGKSTLGELLVGLQQPTGGDIYFDGENTGEYSKSERREFRRRCQVIFQDPYNSLNPRFTVARTVNEPLKIHGIGDRESREARVFEAIEEAGLQPVEKFLDRVPAELSGGERQRVNIARALALDPDFLLADEPVSMLDVSVKTGILQLFERLQKKKNLTMVYISHDLSTVNYLTDRTMIMYMGNVVELGGTENVIHETAHPYTRRLISAVADPDPDVSREKKQMQGDVPDPINLPAGCRYYSECPNATQRCNESEPPLEELEQNHQVACYHPVDRESTVAVQD